MQPSDKDSPAATSTKPRSLYRELTIALVVLVSLVSVTATTLNYFHVSRDAEASYENRSSEYAVYLREALEWPLWNIDDELIGKIGSAFASNAEIATLIVRDDQQRVVFQQEKISGHQLKHSFTIEHNGQNIGSVEIGMDLSAYEEREQQLLMYSIATMLLLIVVLLGATRWILSRLLRKPLDALIGVADEIVEGKFLQIEPLETYVEFTPVLSGFKTMSDAVAGRESSLRQINENLAKEIDERKQAESALRESEERLQLATKAGKIGIWDWDVVNNILTWDESMYDLYGIRQEDFGGAYDAWISTLHTDDRQYTDGEIQAALRGEREYEPEFRIVRPDGIVRNIKAASKTFRDSQGKPTRMIGTNFDITERKKAEEIALGASKYARSLIEASLDPLVTISAEGKITDVNEGSIKVTGVRREELIGTDFSNYFTEPEKARAGYQQVFSEGFVTDYPLTIRHRNGKLTDVLYNASVYRDAHGKVLGVFAAARDVTERNLMEEELKESEQRYHLLFNNNPLPMWVFATDSLKFLEVNEHTVEHYGYTRDEFRHMTIRDIRLPEDNTVLNNILSSSPDGKIVTEARHKKKNGALIDVIVSTMPMMYGTTPARIVLVQDITERKRAEEQLRRSRQVLAEAQRIAHLGSWYLDLATNEVDWSEELYKLYGLDPTQPPPLFTESMKLFTSESWERLSTAITRASENGIPYEIELEAVPKEGSNRWMLARGELVRDAQGAAVALRGIVMDITERKRAEEELRRYKDHLEEEVLSRTADLLLARNAAEAANRAKSVFLSSMSHELRTPLNAILGFSSMLRKDSQLRQEQRENIDIINRSGEHLLTLINDVLEMAKIESGRVEVEHAPFDLGGMLRDVTDMMHMRAREKGLQLLVDQSSQFPRYIKGDEARLRQVLINLVGNAVKFTQQGGVTVRFGIKPHAPQRQLLIEVEDSGSGIRPEDQQRIFEPFVQLSESAMQKGTGLGLTITRQYVKLMGGTITVESTPGKGSIFRVELPVEMVAAGDLVKTESVVKGEVLGLVPDQPEYRILIVEDQVENQLLLTQLMKNIGLSFKVAENGEQAVDIFQRWSPHLIWMDRRMPVMDGIEATRRIRALPGGKEVKIVAVTASAFTEQRDEMLAAGMDDFVRKPFRFNEIYECLTKQLGVQYTYADTQKEEVGAVELTAEMLAVLPPGLRYELRAALESLEEERITAALGQVADHDAKLYKILSHLAGNFDYPAILKALQAN